MNMKKMMVTAAMAAILGTGTIPSAYADVSVEDVKCTQRYPWNGLVDIEYTIACDDPEADIYVNPVGFNGDTGLTVFPTHFTGDGATNTVKAGKHTMVWDAKADMGNLFATKNFQIKMYAGKKLSRYIVIDISGGADAEDYPVRYSVEGPNIADDTCRTTEIWMRLIPPGTFMMGSPADELGRSDREDLHQVTLTKPYYIGVYEITQRQWELVMGDRPSYFNRDDQYATRPVETISFNRMRGELDPFSQTVGKDSFIGVLRTKTSRNGFDLPTDAQWEYACRAGAQTALYSGRNLMGTQGCDFVGELARYFMNGYNGGAVSQTNPVTYTTAKVGSYKPNAIGLYDMLGNVSEICKDGYYKNLGNNPEVDPVKGKRLNYDYQNSDFWDFDGQRGYHVVERGGHWLQEASCMRSGFRRHLWAETNSGNTVEGDRYRYHYCVGIRLCCSGNLQ